MVKNLLTNAGDADSIPGSGRSSGGGNGNPLQCACLGNSMDREFWQVMYGCESWTVKKAERRRIDAFELWCWRRLLRFLGLQGDQSWVFIGRTDVEPKTPILWPPDAKS